MAQSFFDVTTVIYNFRIQRGVYYDVSAGQNSFQRMWSCISASLKNLFSFKAMWHPHSRSYVKLKYSYDLNYLNFSVQLVLTLLIFYLHNDYSISRTYD